MLISFSFLFRSYLLHDDGNPGSCSGYRQALKRHIYYANNMPACKYEHISFNRGFLRYFDWNIRGLCQAFCPGRNIPPGACSDKENMRSDGFRG